MWHLKTRVLFLSLLALVFCHTLFAQDTLKTDSNKLDFLDQIDQRKWRVKVPIWVPGFRGTFAYGGVSQLPEGGDYSVIDRLEGELGITFYLIGDIRFKPKKWLFAVNGFHTTLASNLKFENIDKIEFPATIDGTILRGLVGYQVFEKINAETHFKAQIHPYAGFRYIDLHIYSEKSNIIDISPDWFEPLVGVNILVNHRRWFFTGILDVGGFSINNHWSGFASLEASYRFSKLFALGAGWSYLEFNYDQDFKLKYLNLNIGLSGPVLGVEFNF